MIVIHLYSTVLFLDANTKHFTDVEPPKSHDSYFIAHIRILGRMYVKALHKTQLYLFVQKRAHSFF